MEIFIYPNKAIISAAVLKERLELDMLGQSAGVEFSLRNAPIPVRGMDPTVLVAIVGAVGTAFGALLSGLIQVAKKAAARTITIQAANGSRIEFPADLSSEEIDILIEKSKKLNVQKILID